MARRLFNPGATADLLLAGSGRAYMGAQAMGTRVSTIFTTAFALVSLLAAPTPAGAGEPEEQDTAPEAAAGPTVGPAHADCDHRMPMWMHEVQPGEQLGMVAGRYGVRSAELLRLNPQIANADLIRIGDSLRVCPEIYPRQRETVSHIVAPGDTLSAIAERYGVPVEEIVESSADAPANPDHLRVGQTLTQIGSAACRGRV